jgi:hypothetical protein
MSALGHKRNVSTQVDDLASHPTEEAHCLLVKGCNLGPHQFRTRNNLIGTQRTQSNSNENPAKSTKPIDILPLITVWLQVRVLPGPPVFAREASFGSASPRHQFEAQRDAVAPQPTGKADRCRECRLGKAIVAGKIGVAPAPTKISKTTPCKVETARKYGFSRAAEIPLLARAKPKGLRGVVQGLAGGDAAMPHSKPAQCLRSGQTDARSQSTVGS